MQQQEAYPVRFTVEYPDRPLDRLTTGLRILVAIPILIVLGAVSGGGGWESSAEDAPSTAAAAGGLLFCGPVLLILFRRKYPRWWFDWNLELQRSFSGSRRWWWWSWPGSRSCSPAAIRGACSTSWRASSAGTTALSPTPGHWSPTATHRSASPNRTGAAEGRGVSWHRGGRRPRRLRRSSAGTNSRSRPVARPGGRHGPWLGRTATVRRRRSGRWPGNAA
jgi:hypothetical protein